jgi:hypothetical protein
MAIRVVSIISVDTEVRKELRNTGNKLMINLTNPITPPYPFKFGPTIDSFTFGNRGHKVNN